MDSIFQRSSRSAFYLGASVVSLAVEDFTREKGAGESDQKVLKETQSGWTEFLPNANIELSPSFHPQKNRLA